jgi:hypothetical protein
LEQVKRPVEWLQRRGDWLIVASGALLLTCLSCSGLTAYAYFELPRRGWNTVQACAGLAVGRQRAGIWWTSPIYSPAPAQAYSTPYALCGSVPWPPNLVTSGNRTFGLPALPGP